MDWNKLLSDGRFTLIICSELVFKNDSITPSIVFFPDRVSNRLLDEPMTIMKFWQRANKIVWKMINILRKSACGINSFLYT